MALLGCSEPSPLLRGGWVVVSRVIATCHKVDAVPMLACCLIVHSCMLLWAAYLHCHTPMLP